MTGLLNMHIQKAPCTMTKPLATWPTWRSWLRFWQLTGLAMLVFGLFSGTARAAEESQCARVKIEIQQELALERQAFEAIMKINNGLDTMALDQIKINLTFLDDTGVAVKATSDSNDTTAQFYVRVDSMSGIADINGNGSVAPASTGEVHWLIIPAPGSGGTVAGGKKYLVGASLSYVLNGEAHSVEVVPDTIYVKPMPLLTLDYFLTKEVIADDPMTAPVEPSEPFTLGVRVKNTGAADAHNLTIDSAQPKIVENNQGLLINFLITGSYLDDQPATNSLLINFGDVPAARSRIGRWNMQTSLAGQFVEFSAQFTHADELGGTLTSLIQATNTHFLLRDVKVDVPGRDNVRDFLALDGAVLRVYESDLLDSDVIDLSASATLSSSVNAQGQAVYRLTAPATPGFMYVRLPDPYQGSRVLAQVVRSDGKYMLGENVWLSKTKNGSQQWDYWINFFDLASTGVYDTQFGGAPQTAQPPVIQLVADQVVKEGQRVSFVVEASSPAGVPVALSASPLPVGATFVQESASTTLTRSVFDWTPAKGQAGSYFIAYLASDGTLSATRSATITVLSDEPPPGPAVPQLVSPLNASEITSLRPTLVVQTGQAENDPTQSVQFELYADVAMQTLLQSAVVSKGQTTAAAGTTSYTVTSDLGDNTTYWWRARASDGATLYSEWVYGEFRINQFNDAPTPFNLLAPEAGVEVATLLPELVLSNTSDKDGDSLSYAFDLYTDAALTQRLAGVAGLPPGDNGQTRWQLGTALQNHATYYWKATATDTHGSLTETLPRSFIVNTGNTAPSQPVPLQPAQDSTVVSSSATLQVANSSDGEADPLLYTFELDTSAAFDSVNRQLSAALPAGEGAVTSWLVSGLLENQHYYWRVTVSDGRASVASSTSHFFKNALNDAPPAATINNPGNGAWVATLQPLFEVNPVLDPEGSPVSYRFELYRDAALTQAAGSGFINTGTSWIPEIPLLDKTTYYWRVRAEDSLGLAGAWSAVATLYVSTGAYVVPSIVMSAPATIVTPQTGAEGSTVNLAWTGTAPNIEAQISLYHDSDVSGLNGTGIVSALPQAAGSVNGQYQWNLAGMPPGAYYFYASISDPLGTGSAYAPGVLVIPASPQLGSVQLTAAQALTTTSAGGSSSFTVALAYPPTADVVLPVSSSNTLLGVVSPAQLTFTAANWNAAQTVTVTGVSGSSGRGSQTYQVTVGNATSLDPNYINVAGGSLPVTHSSGGIGGGGGGRGNITNSTTLQLSGYTVSSQKKLANGQIEYSMSALLRNDGSAIAGASLSLQSAPAGYTVLDASLSFAALGSSQIAPSKDTFTVRVPASTPRRLLESGAGLTWILR